MKLGPRPHRGDLSVQHDYGLEQRASESVSLGRVSIVPGPAGVEQIALEPIEDLRSPVGVGFDELGHLGPEPGPPRFVLAFLDVTHLVQVGQPPELPLERLPLSIALGDFRPSLAIGIDDPLFRFRREQQALQIAPQLILNDADSDALRAAALHLPTAPTRKPLCTLDVHRLTAPAAAHQPRERVDATLISELVRVGFTSEVQSCGGRWRRPWTSTCGVG